MVSRRSKNPDPRVFNISFSNSNPMQTFEVNKSTDSVLTCPTFGIHGDQDSWIASIRWWQGNVRATNKSTDDLSLRQILWPRTWSWSWWTPWRWGITLSRYSVNWNSPSNTHLNHWPPFSIHFKLYLFLSPFLPLPPEPEQAIDGAQEAGFQWVPAVRAGKW